MNFLLGIVASSKTALALVLDLFNRTNNSTSLGTVSGQGWRVWRGVWGIVSNKASSSSAAGDNALATLRFTKTDVTVSISGADPGMGAAFWVTDANNWYASVYTQTQACQTCSNCNAFSGGNCNSFVPGNCNATSPGNCNVGAGVFCCFGFTPGTCAITGCSGGWTPGNCIVFNSANTGNRAPPYGFCHQPSGFNPSTCNNSFVCLSSNPATCNNGYCCSGDFNTWSPYCSGTTNPATCSNAPGSFNPVVCNAVFTFSCNCVTEHRISLLRSLAGAVSIISNNLFSSAIQSFKIILSGSQATIQSFSTTSYTSQIGNSIVQSITAPQKTTQHGIIKSTSSFQQGSSIDEFGVG
jgi:hypothetical protein